MDLAWWALATLQVLTLVWLVVLIGGFWRLQRALRDARAACEASAARKNEPDRR